MILFFAPVLIVAADVYVAVAYFGFGCVCGSGLGQARFIKDRGAATGSSQYHFLGERRVIEVQETAAKGNSMPGVEVEMLQAGALVGHEVRRCCRLRLSHHDSTIHRSLEPFRQHHHSPRYSTPSTDS